MTGMPDRWLLFPLFFLICSFLALHTQPVYGAPESLPTFELKDINGGGVAVSDADLKGKVILLNIWASWCPGCEDEMPELMQLQEQFGSERFSVIAVNIDNKVENALSFLEKFPNRIGRSLNFPVLYDGDKTIAKGLRPTFLPTSYLISADGRIVLILGGSITENRLNEVSNAIRSTMGAP